MHVPGQGQQPDGARGVRDGEIVAPDVTADTLVRVRVVTCDARDCVA